GGRPPATRGYDKRRAAILDVMHSPPPPSASISPTGAKMLLVTTVEYPSMARVAEPFLRLAGVRLEPRNRSKHDTPGGYGIRPCARAYDLVTVPAGAVTHVPLAKDACPAGPLWSADGARFALQDAQADPGQLSG